MTRTQIKQKNDAQYKTYCPSIICTNANNTISCKAKVYIQVKFQQIQGKN